MADDEQRKRYLDRFRGPLIGIVALMFMAVACGEEDEGFRVARRAANGTCPVPREGTYVATIIFGENNCGETPGASATSTTFIEARAAAEPMRTGFVPDPEVCLVDAEFTADGTHFRGSYEYASDTRFRFRGTVTLPTCVAKVVIVWRRE